MTPLKIFASLAALTFTCTPLLAAPLSPGGVILTNGTSIAADPDQAGLVLNDDLIATNFGVGFGQATYRVQNRVVQSNNLGTLIFSPRIRDPFNSGYSFRFEIVAFSLTGFSGFNLLDVDFKTDGQGDKGQTTVSRSLDGDLLTFRYGNPLLNDFSNPPGVRDEALFPTIKTNATRFKNVGTMTLFGRRSDAGPNDLLESVTITGIAAPVVPLPASAFLLLSSLAGIGAFVRRKRA